MSVKSVHNQIMQTRHIKHPFPAVIDGNSRILILGSVPSIKSVEGNFYYMHPQNRFWRVLSSLFNTDLYSMSVEERKSFLLSHHVALYDSVEECDIEGSSDSKISNVTPADIQSLVDCSQISHIFCNGKASYNVFLKYHPTLSPIASILPSTSPANAVFTLDKLISEWKVILDYLE